MVEIEGDLSARCHGPAKPQAARELMRIRRADAARGYLLSFHPSGSSRAADPIED